MAEWISRMDAAWRRRRKALLRRVFDGARGRKSLIDMMGEDVVALTLRRDDHLVSFSPHELIGRRVFASGDFDRQLVERVVAILDGAGLLAGRDALVELGANIGTQTLYFALTGRFGRILAVEPDPRNLMLLRRNVAENGLDGMVEIAACAVGSREGEIELFRSHGNHGDSSVVRSRHDAGSVHVPLRRVDALIADAAISADDIALVWMDIEGAEPDACDSMEALMRIGVPIMMEFSPDLYGTHAARRFVDRLASFYPQAVHFRRGEEKPMRTSEIPIDQGQFDILLLPPGPR